MARLVLGTLKMRGSIALALAAAFIVAGAGTADARSPHHRASVTSAASGSGADYYTNVSGHRVHRPVQASSAPAGASAKCGDGTYSFSEHRRGTCSHHGGVSMWLGH